MVFRHFGGLYLVEEVLETNVLLIDIAGIEYNYISRSRIMSKIEMNFGTQWDCHYPLLWPLVGNFAWHNFPQEAKVKGNGNPTPIQSCFPTSLLLVAFFLRTWQ